MGEIEDEILDDYINDAEDVFSSGEAETVEEPLDIDETSKPISLKKDVKEKELDEKSEKSETKGKDIMAKPGYLEVTRVYKIDGKETEESVSISTPVHVFITQPALVNVKMGATINMGNYESARVDVSLVMPCYAEDINAVYKDVLKFVEDKTEEQVNEIKGIEKDDEDERSAFMP